MSLCCPSKPYLDGESHQGLEGHLKVAIPSLGGKDTDFLPNNVVAEKKSEWPETVSAEN